MRLSQERLKAILSYDPETGNFTRLVHTSARTRRHTTVGTNSGDGYLATTIDYKCYRLHQLAWFYIYGEWAPLIDHINGDKKDNRISNLRSVSQSVNMHNTGKLGVSYRHDRKKWRARIVIKQKEIFIGHFASYLEAELAYRAKKKELGLF